ncbi:MAG: hypothetical protein ACON46_07615 [Coraliomargaritaceae bacterium]
MLHLPTARRHSKSIDGTRNRSLLLLLLVSTAIPACKTFDYPPEELNLDGNSIHVANIGFKGFRLHPPPGFRRLSPSDSEALPQRHWLTSLRNGYRGSNGIDYHFYTDHVFEKEGQLIYFVPLQNKPVRQFRFVPPDILERYLINWAHKAEFSKRIHYKLACTATSDRTRGRSTAILQSKEPVHGQVYEQRVVTGDLDEMFLFAAFAHPDHAAALTQLVNSLEVIR